MPGLTYAADAHYHHLVDDIISGGPINCEEGEMRVPSGPGLGVTLDRDKLKEFSALAGNYGTAPQTSITGDPMELQHLPVLPRW